MEPLASLEHIKSEVDLWTVSFPLDAIESILKIKPKADLLQSRPTGGIALKTSHLQCTDRQTNSHYNICRNKEKIFHWVHVRVYSNTG